MEWRPQVSFASSANYEYNYFNQLAAETINGYAVEMAYNADDIRTAKASTSGVIQYLLNGGDVLSCNEIPARSTVPMAGTFLLFCRPWRHFFLPLRIGFYRTNREGAKPMELLKKEYPRYSLLTQTEQLREETQTVIVPDTQPDVYGVLQVNAFCQVRQKHLRQDAVVLEGTVEAEVLCVAEEESQWQTVRVSLPFSQEYTLAGCTEESVVQVHLEAVRCEALLRNPRKLQVQIQTCATLRLFGTRTLTVVEGASGAEDEGLELLSQMYEPELVRCVAEKKLMAAEELPLEAGEHLLRWDVSWKQEEIRVLTNKVMLRGEAVVRAVLLDGDETVVREAELPFSQVVECENAQQGDQAEAEYATLQAQIALLEGENPVLSCTVTGCVWVTVKSRLRLSVLRDAYSTCWQTELRWEEPDCAAVACELREVPVNESFSVGEKVEKLLDCTCCARGNMEDGGRPGGTFRFSLLYRTEGGRLRCTERTVRATSDTPVTLTDPFCRAYVRQLAVHAGEDGQIALRFTAALEVCGLRQQPCTQVWECTLDREHARPLPPPGTLVLRNVEDGETVWSIAKGCGARRQEILSANRLENAVLTPGKLIMIPFSR